MSPHTKIAILVAQLYYPQYEMADLLEMMTNRGFLRRLSQRIQKDINLNKDHEEIQEIVLAAFDDPDPEKKEVR